MKAAASIAPACHTVNRRARRHARPVERATGPTSALLQQLLRRSLRMLFGAGWASFLALFCGPAVAAPPTVTALPTGATVTSGTATITQSGNNLTVLQGTNKAILDWNSFNIGQQASVTFKQPGINSVALNRVAAGNPSAIYGTLSANGKVWLINPSGIMVGPGGTINVAGFVASTLEVTDNDFLAGRLNFAAGKVAGDIVNQGSIAGPRGASIYLVAPNVDNNGIIHAPGGEIILAAGHTVQLREAGTPFVSVSVTGADTAVTNLGNIISEAGRIGIAGAILSNSGIVSATSAVEDGGRIFFKATQAMALSPSSVVSADGNRGGDINARVERDANVTGSFSVAGKLSATGSAPGGNGGSIETSAAKLAVDQHTFVDTRAAHGKSGTWLLDPSNFTIGDTATGADISGAAVSAALQTSNVTLTTATADRTVNGVPVNEPGDFTVNQAVDWNTANTLSISALRDITINAPIRGPAGTVNLRLDASGSCVSTGSASCGTLSFGSGGLVNANLTNFYYNPTGSHGQGSPSYATPASTSNIAPISGQLALWMLINDAAQLQAMSTNLAGKYALGRDINAANTAYGTPSGSFAPVGPGSGTVFSGTLDGLNHNVSNLNVAYAYGGSPSTPVNLGMFGELTGEVRNLGLAGSVNADTAYDNIGFVAGINRGTISNVHVAATPFPASTVTSIVGFSTVNIGGIAGLNSGTITNSSNGAEVLLQGYTGSAGGLVGFNDVGGTIAGSTNNGHVGNFQGNDSGGLVGYNAGNITSSTNNGLVNGRWFVGGIVGWHSDGLLVDVSNSAKISMDTGGSASAIGGIAGESTGGGSGNGRVIFNRATNSGEVAGGDAGAIGGIIGYAYDSAIASSSNSGFIHSSRNGSNMSTQFIGGLIGRARSVSNVSGSVNTGNVATSSTAYGGPTNIGGLIGSNESAVTSSSNAGSVSFNNDLGGNIGGLIGDNAGPITLSSNVGAVNGGSADMIGGLVGRNYNGGSIQTSTSQGLVASGNGSINGPDHVIGGLVGLNSGTITNSSNDAEVLLQGYAGSAGGLVGFNDVGATIAGSTNNGHVGNVQGSDTGGLVGYNAGNITSSTNTGLVNGSKYVGGIVGWHLDGLLVDVSNSAKITMDTAQSGAEIGGIAGHSTGGGAGGGAVIINRASNSGEIAGGDASAIGGLVGNANGSGVATSANSGYVYGDRQSESSSTQSIGGLIGNAINSSNVSASVNTGDVRTSLSPYGGTTNIGGLIGSNGSAVTTSSNAGSVSFGNALGGNIGGLVGNNAGPITMSGNVGAVYGGSADRIGGLVGRNYDVGTIQTSTSQGTVSWGNARINTPGQVVGGLVGLNEAGTSVDRSYAKPSLQIEVEASSVAGQTFIGGFVGQNDGTITNSFVARGAGITAYGGTIGAFVGLLGGTIQKTYSAISSNETNSSLGFAGQVSAGPVTLTGSSFDVELFPVSSSIGQALTSAQLKQAANFSAFDFTNTWRIYEGQTDPLLRYFLSPLSVSSASASKVYDATQTQFSGTASYDRFNPGDTLQNSVGGTLGYGTALNVGTYSLSGLYSTKYDISYAAGSELTITARPLAIFGLSANNKVYDATTAATFAGNASVSALGTDNVTVTGTAAGSFANKNVGTAKPVSVSGLTLGGTDAGNYTAVQPTGLSANITPAQLAIAGLSANNKVYDTTTVASLSGSASVAALGADSVTVGGTAVGSFANKNIGTAKPVSVTGLTLGGTDAGNYTAVQPAGMSANITPAALSITGISVANKIYDTTTAASFAGTPTATGIGADDVAIGSFGTLRFTDKNVGDGKSVVLLDTTLRGIDAANYTLVAPAGLSANITPAQLVITGLSASSKTYDATTVASLSGTASVAALGADSVTVSGAAAGSFADKNVGSAKPVSVSGLVLGGADARNYTGIQPSGLRADITPADLPVTGLTVADKTADGTNVAGLVGTPRVTPLLGDQVALSGNPSAVFSDATVGSSKPVTVSGLGIAGPDAGNYLLREPPGLTADINAVIVAPPPDLPAQRNAAVTAMAAIATATATATANANANVNAAVVSSMQPALQAPPVVVDKSPPLANSPQRFMVLAEQRRQERTTMYSQAIDVLKINPDAADLKPCDRTSRPSDVCMPGPVQAKQAGSDKQAEKPADAAALTQAPGSDAALAALEQLKVVQALPPAVEIRRKTAYLIGNNAYKRPIPRLLTPIGDARAVAGELRDLLGYEVKVLPNATKAEMVQLLKTIGDTSDRDDSVLVFYAGHGYETEQKQGYWIPIDASPNDPATWISNNDIAKLLARIPAKQVILISDSCYSGSLVSEEKIDTAQVAVQRDDILRKRSVTVMSSGGEEPVSDAGKEGHSIFAWSLLENIRSVKGVEKGGDLFQQIKGTFTKEYPQSPQYGPVASAGHDTGGDYLVEPVGARDAPAASAANGR